MNARYDRLHADLTDLAEQVTVVDLRDRALRTSRKLRTLRTILGAAAAFVLLTIGAGTAFAVLPGRHTGGPSSSQPQPGGPPISSPATTFQPSPVPSASLCQATDLTYLSQAPAGAAMGNVYTRYSMRNRSSHACMLSGAPVITYQRADRTAALLPAQPDPTAPTVVVPASATVEFRIDRAGAGDFASDSPSCTHNGAYQGLAVRFSDGSVPLGNVGFTVQACEEVVIDGWRLSGP
jgi:hypothetical protein